MRLLFPTARSTTQDHPEPAGATKAPLDSLLPLVARDTVLRRLRPADLHRFHAYRFDSGPAIYQGWSAMTLSEAKEFIDAMADVAALRGGKWIPRRRCAMLGRDTSRIRVNPENLTASAPGERSKDLPTPLGAAAGAPNQALQAAEGPSWSLPRALAFPMPASMPPRQSCSRPDAHASGNNSPNSERGECTVTSENTRP